MSQTMTETAPDPLDGALSANYILSTEYPPLEYVVDGLIPEGLTLLVAAPKIGKSWLVLSLGIACANGSKALGKIPVAQRPVLYLALEDGQRRLQSRLNALGAADQGDNRQLVFLTELGGLPPAAPIAAFLNRHFEQKPLIILDTLGRARGVYSGNDAYQKDYGEMASLKRLIDSCPGSSLIVVHHTNKRGGDSGDFLGAVSGTQGLAGAADSIIVIERARGGSSSKLKITSRDAKEGEYGVELTDSGQWVLCGESLEESAQALSEQEHTADLSDDTAKILAVVDKYPDGESVANIAQLSGVDKSKVGKYLQRLDESGRIRKIKRGFYGANTLSLVS